MKGICIFLANGFEDMEALATLDVLRRGALAVRTVSITADRGVLSSRGVPVQADVAFPEWEAEAAVAEPAGREDVMIFPGGMPGTRNLSSHGRLMALMQRHYTEGGTVAAICAAPGLVASQLPDIKGLRFTCFDGFEAEPMAKGACYVPEGVVVDGRLITGRGAGWAVPFGLAILEYLRGPAAVARVKAGLML